jgi:hypothetical protein
MMYTSRESLPDRSQWREKMLAETPERVCWYLQQVKKLIGSNEGQASEWNAVAQVTLEVIQERKIGC